ncbi:FOP N terminal dimerization domain-containing protein [Neocallimastix lanati (nom. inval.)]|nr:FOP N terminal dimerization domain-containing protein [Neocallimastix sp. JGI-2020a]
MATYEDLKEVLKESLEVKGIINKIKANIRSEVFKAIDDEDQEKPKLSYENLIVNELIREYLEFNNYKFTLSVFLSESNQPNDALDKNFLTKELKVKLDKDSQQLPLLYGLAFQNFTEK